MQHLKYSSDGIVFFLVFCRQNAVACIREGSLFYKFFQWANIKSSRRKYEKTAVDEWWEVRNDNI